MATMAKPVKDEIFGSRKSVLKDKLDIRIFRNLFFATCLRRINPDPASRYIFLQDCAAPAEYKDTGLASIIPFFNEAIRFGNVFFSGEKVQIKNLRNNSGRIFYRHEEFADFLLKLLKGVGSEPLSPSTARIVESEEVSTLSRFLRKNLYGRVGSTDIDFVLFHPHTHRLLLVEEKLFVGEIGPGIGHGQYLSYRELLQDGFAEAQRGNIRFYLLFIPDPGKDICYMYDFSKERSLPQRSPSYYDPTRMEQRIIFPYPDLEKLSVGEFLGKYVFG